MVLETLVQTDQGYEYFNDMIKMFGSNDQRVIKEKMDNLVTLLNGMNDEEYNKFEELDFEDEIWYMI